MLRFVTFLSLLAFVFPVWSQSFSVEDIEIRGIKKIAVGTVLNYLPVEEGDLFDYKDSPKVIRELYETGFFNTISLRQENNSLIVEVVERPAIAEVNYEGNKEVNDEGMQDALKQMGMTKGRIYNPKILETLEQELEQLYYSLGKYAVRIETEATELDADRIKVDITISEGAPAEIRTINLIGNQAFSDEELLDQFKLETSDSGWFAADKYSSVKLSGDLEALKSWYLDQGYVKFSVDSKQVTITPDKKDINISVNVSEGEQYQISAIKLTGNLIVEEEQLLAYLPLRTGDVFSRKKIVTATTLMSKRLGREGYAFASVDVSPEVNDEERTVALTLVVNPGKKMNVRKIHFEGNTKTRDHVLRREMRQMEGAQFSTRLVDRSKVRLQRLRFVSSVSTRYEKVAGQDDLLDIVFSVTERFSGSFTIGAGYAQSQGALFNLSLTHDNIFGTGNRLGVTFDNNKSQQQYKFSYTNPYFTPDGVSRSFTLKYTETDSSEANISNYLIDRIQLGINFGIPLSEYNTLSLGFGAERNDITVVDTTSDEVLNFIIENDDELEVGADFDDVTFDTLYTTLSFSKDSRNRSVFPDKGQLNSIGIEVFGGELDYFKTLYRHQSLFSISDKVTLSFNGRLGHGSAYNDTTDLPFFEKYTAGGIRTVRGYDYNSLGPVDSRGSTFGGNYQIVTNTELLFQVEALGSAESFRLGLYLDAGNVFAEKEDINSSDLRTSIGLSAKWFTAIGPIQLSYAEPINHEPGDETERFQFSLGAPF